jgi:hypothetical protein
VALTEAEELEMLTLEREKAFASTSGGAATGNPNLRRQGDKMIRMTGPQEALVEIGGAGAIGGVLGAASSEILTGAGNVVGALPYPAARTAGNWMKGAGEVLKAGGRLAPTVAGAVSGATSETAGQTAEYYGASPIVAEGARLVGGAVGPEAVTGTVRLLKTYVAAPALSVASKFKKEIIKGIIGKLEGDGPKTLTAKEQQYLDEVTAELRSGPKSDASLEAVGDAMEKGGENAMLQSRRSSDRANVDLERIGSVVPNVAPAEVSDIGGRLRGVITARNAKMKEANDALYKANEEARDKIISQREAAGVYVNDVPEFGVMFKDLTDNLKPGKRSPDVQGTYKHILSQFDATKPITFQALDDVRRSLGEVFRGKPPEGYAAIAADDARKYYAMISDIQKKYAGDAQERLLDDYARGKEGLEPFISAKGRKATALDRYDDTQFVTDASALPETYFKSRSSIRALKQLTGDEKLVNEAAMQFVNKKLEGASASEADAFMRKNSDWLRDVPMVRTAVENYASKRVAAERGVKQAEALVKEATQTSAALTGNRFSADRVRNLVQNGSPELWERAGAAIASSPDGKANILAAVRQVLADKPMTADQFNRTIRPALKTSALADDAALDLIEKKLFDISEMKIPEAEKLGLYRRIALQATSGYVSSATARGAVEAAKMVPD